MVVSCFVENIGFPSPDRLSTPSNMKRVVTDMTAVLVYWSSSRLVAVMESVGVSVLNFPLSYLRRHTLYRIPTVARDRLSTPIEQVGARWNV